SQKWRAKAVPDGQKEYRYVGPTSRPQRMSCSDTALSAENALDVIRRAWREGRSHISSHFKARMKERGIDMLDIEILISCSGVVRGDAEHDSLYGNWKYLICGVVDERQVEVAVALDPNEDISNSPLAVFVTAYERKPNP